MLVGIGNFYYMVGLCDCLQFYLLAHDVHYMLSPSVCLLSVTLVRPTQTVQIFGNISTALCTLASIDIH